MILLFDIYTSNYIDFVRSLTQGSSCFSSFLSDASMLELHPFFHWVHVDAPGQVYCENNEFDILVHFSTTLYFLTGGVIGRRRSGFPQ